MNRTSKIASLLVTGAAALGVVGCGGSSGTTTQAAATQGGTATTQQGTATTQGGTAREQAGRGGPGALDSTALATAAKELGTTSAELQAALEAARPERPSQSSSADAGPPTGTDGTDPRTAMYASVAKALDTTSAKVEAALADVLPSGGPGGPGGPGGGQGGTPPSGAQGTPPAQGGSAGSSTGSTSAS